MIDYIVSSETLIKAHRHFIKRAVVLISDILGDGLYVKIEPRLIALEDEFRKNITISQKQIDDRLSEEVRQLIIERLNINENARLN